jgi:hypothetical protein
VLSNSQAQDLGLILLDEREGRFDVVIRRHFQGKFDRGLKKLRDDGFTLVRSREGKN